MISNTWKTEVLKTIKLIQHNLQCGVCLEFLEDAVLTKCKHLFCKKCILTVFDGTYRALCPLCKTEFTKRSMTSMKHLSQLAMTISKLEGTFVSCLQNKQVELQVPKVELNQSIEIPGDGEQIPLETSLNESLGDKSNIALTSTNKETSKSQNTDKENIEQNQPKLSESIKSGIQDAAMPSLQPGKDKKPSTNVVKTSRARQKTREQSRRTFDFTVNTEDLLPGNKDSSTDIIDRLEDKLSQIKGPPKKTAAPSKQVAAKKLSIIGESEDRNESDQENHDVLNIQNTSLAHREVVVDNTVSSIFDILTEEDVTQDRNAQKTNKMAAQTIIPHEVTKMATEPQEPTTQAPCKTSPTTPVAGVTPKLTKAKMVSQTSKPEGTKIAAVPQESTTNKMASQTPMQGETSQTKMAAVPEMATNETIVLPSTGGAFPCLCCSSQLAIRLVNSQLMISLDQPQSQLVSTLGDIIASQTPHNSPMPVQEESPEDMDDNALDVSSPLIFPTIPEEDHSPTDPALIYANSVLGPLMAIAHSQDRSSAAKRPAKRKYSRIKVTEESSSDSDEVPSKILKENSRVPRTQTSNKEPVDTGAKSDLIRQEIADMKKRIKNMENFLQNEEESNDEDVLYPPSD